MLTFCLALSNKVSTNKLDVSFAVIFSFFLFSMYKFEREWKWTAGFDTCVTVVVAARSFIKKKKLVEHFVCVRKRESR